MERKTHQVQDLIKNNQSVYSATFTFRVKQYDSEFDRLNDLIDQAAEENPGYLGKEQWENSDEDKRSVTYYWKSMELLKKFSRHPIHQKAKQNYSRWYEGYEVIISEILTLKSDHGL